MKRMTICTCMLTVMLLLAALMAPASAETLSVPFDSVASIGQQRNIAPFYHYAVYELFQRDYNGDGVITLEELKENVSWSVTAGEGIILSEKTDFLEYEYEGETYIDGPTFCYRATSEKAQGQKILFKASNTKGDKLVYELTVQLTNLVYNGAKITASPAVNLFEETSGSWQITVEEGTPITVALDCTTRNGSNADVLYSWWMADPVTGMAMNEESLSSASTYTLANPTKTVVLGWDVNLASDESARAGETLHVNVVPKGSLGGSLSTHITPGITEVPVELKSNSMLNTRDKIENTIAVQALAKASELGFDLSHSTAAVFDVTLMYTPEGGQPVPADETHWPIDGKLTVRMPYPQGASANSRLVVAHMFSTSKFGKTAGAIEYPSVRKYPDHFEFEVTGLSPIAVAWSNPIEGAMGTTGVMAAPPTTGDNAQLVLWAVLSVLSLAGAFLLIRAKRFSR